MPRPRSVVGYLVKVGSLYTTGAQSSPFVFSWTQRGAKRFFVKREAMAYCGQLRMTGFRPHIVKLVRRQNA